MCGSVVTGAGLLGVLGALTLCAAHADPIPLKSGDGTSVPSQDATAQPRTSESVSRCIEHYPPARTADEAVAISKRCRLNPCYKPTAPDDTTVKWGPPTLDYYPPKAKRDGVTGRVGLECSIDEKGHARNILVLESGGPLLDDGAKALLADLRFKVPIGWSATGGPTRRLRYGVIFRLAGKPDVACFEDNRQTVVVNGIPEK
jgi:TonB family protein